MSALPFSDPLIAPSAAATAADEASADAAPADIDFSRRFGGVARLYGAAALQRFRQAHVCVIGVGGVGSWVVEALARSAIGQITMIDLDHLAESNINRQIHALTSTLGQAKVTALAERVAQINPFCHVNQIEDFIDAENLGSMIGTHRFDFIVDAIDNVRAKTALIAYCRTHHYKLITIGGAGGQVDPTKIEVRDLCRTEQEPLLAKVRKRLRSEHGFPRGTKNKFGIDAVFSTEPLQFPDATATAGDTESTVINNIDDGDSDAIAQQPQSSGITGLNCAGFGSAMVVTAAFGLVAAAQVLNRLAAEARGSETSGSASSHPAPRGA